MRDGVPVEVMSRGYFVCICQSVSIWSVGIADRSYRQPIADSVIGPAKAGPRAGPNRPVKKTLSSLKINLTRGAGSRLTFRRLMQEALDFNYTRFCRPISFGDKRINFSYIHAREMRQPRFDEYVGLPYL
jgi:hypothetical protein